MTSPIDFVLVRPARPANVAAACRALKNMGLPRLTVVSPPAGLEAPEARALAYGAWDVLDGIAFASDLRGAVASATFVVGTSGKGGEGAWSPRQLAVAWRARAGREGRLAIVFGPEASGLRREELDLCHETVRIPTAPVQSSLNLAQAVLIVAYELATEGDPGALPSGADRADVETLEHALDELREGLLAIGYLNPQNPDVVLTELRRLLARAGPTRREAILLRGLARQIRWAGGR